MNNTLNAPVEVKYKRELKPFKLANEPVLFALSFHFNNLFVYFHPHNENLRLEHDKDSYAHVEQILSVFQWLLHNDQYIETYVEMRSVSPIEFRCSQMIQHYGSEEIKRWIHLFYGKVI